MKAHTRHLLQTLVFLTLLSLLGIKAAYSQSITPAGDTPTTISSPTSHPNQFDINGGTRSGANLFHSFYQFGLSQGQIANFLSSPSIQNILGRVVGGNASIINGLLQVTGGSSNLFLMNPAGIIFGPNARLNVPASFMSTTANGIQLGDRWFNATGPNNYAGLSGTPNSVAFLGSNPGVILNAGTLKVGAGQSITLLGGTVINTGTIEAPGGTITIASVPGENMVRISQSGSLLSLKLPLQSTQGLNPPTITPLSLPALLTGGEMPEATGVTVENGVVRLIGTTIPISTVPGTTINNGNLSVNSATVQGNGGQVSVWGDKTQVSGWITANGGANRGNGGLVETSGQQQLDLTGAKVEARATQGLPGTWVIDPSDITIANTVGTVTPAQIETTLDHGTNIALTTALGIGGNGDIILADSITQMGEGIASLTLTGRRFTNPGNQTISMTSTGGLTFNLNQVNPEVNAPTSSIQSAVNAIGAVAGSRTINLGPGTYSGQTLTIDRTLNLNGSGPSNTILSGNYNNRVMTITSGHTVTMDGVAIANGMLLNQGSYLANSSVGGGIYNEGSTLTLYNSTVSSNSLFAYDSVAGSGIYNKGGTLTLYNSTISDNTANAPSSGKGGGIYNEGGTLTLYNSTVAGNQVSAMVGGSGAGIYNQAGSLTLYNSTVSNNLATGGKVNRGNGGGIYNSEGTLVLVNSTLRRNLAGAGGGISNNSGTVTLYTSTVSENTARSQNISSGGGISNESGTLTLYNSTVSDNSVHALKFYGDNRMNSYGGGISNTSGTVTLYNSTVSNNLSFADSASSYNGELLGNSYGGGIYNASGKLTLYDSTVSGNVAGADISSNASGAPGISYGGGIYNGNVFYKGSGSLNLYDSTITDNSTVGRETVGGGIYNVGETPYPFMDADGTYQTIPGGHFTVRNSLIAGNRAATGREIANLGVTISEGYNLFGYANSSGLVGINLGSTDLVPKVGLDRILAPLTNNGGSTQTHALVPGSPAINAGDPNLTSSDQRGFPRVGRADIGAFEFQSLNPLPVTPNGSSPEINLSTFSLADISEITAALYGTQNELPTLTLQPQPTKSLLCVVRSRDGNGQRIDEYGGLPDCP